jgi:hypothetical protein
MKYSSEKKSIGKKKLGKMIPMRQASQVWASTLPQMLCNIDRVGILYTTIMHELDATCHDLEGLNVGRNFRGYADDTLYP